jgi:polar amino acid transport system substrate-binding protein
MKRSLTDIRLPIVVGVTLLAACTSAPRPQPSPTPSADCRSLTTITPGRLTWAARNPGNAPWTIGDPADGRGYEAAVAAAVSRELSYPADRVDWVRHTGNSMRTPGQKNFDIGFDQVQIAAQREPAISFSPSYYDVRQAVIAREDNAALASVSTAAGLASARLGAPADSPALASIAATIHPATAPTTFPTSDAMKQALLAGAVDAVVVDLPTAFYLTTVELAGTRVVGALPQTTASPPRFGFVLPADSPIATCVAAAVTELRRDGTLGELEAAWLGRQL